MAQPQVEETAGPVDAIDDRFPPLAPLRRVTAEPGAGLGRCAVQPGVDVVTVGGEEAYPLRLEPGGLQWDSLAGVQQGVLAGADVADW